MMRSVAMTPNGMGGLLPGRPPGKQSISALLSAPFRLRLSSGDGKQSPMIIDKRTNVYRCCAACGLSPQWGLWEGLRLRRKHRIDKQLTLDDLEVPAQKYSDPAQSQPGLCIKDFQTACP
jgi:hypothetical protein